MQGDGGKFIQDSNYEEDESVMRPGEGYTDLPASSKIDLWKKLQDLIRNQFREEQQVVRDKVKKLTSQHKKYFKVNLPKTELDKFKPGKSSFFAFDRVSLHQSNHYYASLPLIKGLAP